jgi:hypothetical protein
MRSVATLFWGGILLLALAGFLLLLKADYFFKGVAVQGTVVGFELRGGSRGRTHHPVVEYQGGSRTYRVTGGFAVSPNPYRKGDQIPVLYLLEDPRSAIINDLFQTYLFPILGSALGCLAIVIAVVRVYWPLVAWKGEAPDSV